MAAIVEKFDCSDTAKILLLDFGTYSCLIVSSNLTLFAYQLYGCIIP